MASTQTGAVRRQSDAALAAAGRPAFALLGDVGRSSNPALMEARRPTSSGVGEVFKQEGVKVEPQWPDESPGEGSK